MAYLVCLEGHLEASSSECSLKLEQHDAAEVLNGPTEIEFKGRGAVLICEMAHQARSGRKDI